MAKDLCAVTGERIRKLRRARNWRQIDLADQSGVHEVQISDLERGTREPGLRTLGKIALALDTTLSELLKGLQSRPPSEAHLSTSDGYRNRAMSRI